MKNPNDYQSPDGSYDPIFEGWEPKHFAGRRPQDDYWVFGRTYAGGTLLEAKFSMLDCAGQHAAGLLQRFSIRTNVNKLDRNRLFRGIYVFAKV